MIWPMCAPAVCMQSKWTPAIMPAYRPPKSNGWTIREMPEIFPDQLRAAWRIRPKALNQNGNEAVLEMANFAKMNGADVTREVLGVIRHQADVEWCTAEPSRCARAGVTTSSASTPRQATAAEIQQARKAHVHMRAPAPARAPTRRCCGGRPHRVR